MSALTDAIADLPDLPYPHVADAPLRASWAGMCARQVSYMLAGEPGATPLDAPGRMAYAVGHALGDLVAMALRKLHPDGCAEAEGLLEVDPDFGVLSVSVLAAPNEHPRIGCHADYYSPGWVWEVKTMQPYAWDRARQEGPQPHHIAQAGMCALAMRAHSVVMVYVDKAKGRVAEYPLAMREWHPVAVAEAMRLASILDLHRAGTLADPIHPHQRHWRCGFCAWAQQCSGRLPISAASRA